VVLDDRHDLYGAEFLKDYLKIVHVEPGWDDALAKAHADWVLAPDESPLANILKQSSGWKQLHEDSTAVLFRRTN